MKPLKTIAMILLLSFGMEQLAFAAVPTVQNISHSKTPFVLNSIGLPNDMGLIKEVYQSLVSDKTIYLIEDAHTNESAQLNISKILELLIQKQNVSQIFLEASNGDMSLSDLRDKATLKKRQEVALKYIKKGLLQGSEYTSLTTSHDISLWGVEDMQLYDESLELYKQVIQKRNDLELYLAKIKSTYTFLKQKLLNSMLFEFVELKQDYQKEHISVIQYLDKLLNLKEVYNLKIICDHSYLKHLRRLKAREEQINFEQVNIEYQELINASDDVAGLKLKALNSAENQADLIKHLSDLRHRYGQKKGYKELQNYLGYLKQISRIDIDQVFSELNSLEDEITTALIMNSTETRLVHLGKDIQSLDDLIHMQLKPEDAKSVYDIDRPISFKYVTGQLNKIIFESKAYQDKAIFLEPELDQELNKSKAFYSLTLKRDKAFIQNTIDAMTKANDDHAILITGGYHSPHLQTLMKQYNISFVSIQPAVLHPTDHSRYESILSSQSASPTITIHPISTTMSPKPVRMAGASLPFNKLAHDLGIKNSSTGHGVNQHGARGTGRAETNGDGTRMAAAEARGDSAAYMWELKRPEANYIIVPERHFKERPISAEVLQRVDAVVMEGGQARYKHENQNVFERHKRDTRQTLHAAIEANKTPVFYIDMPPLADYQEIYIPWRSTWLKDAHKAWDIAVVTTIAGMGLVWLAVELASISLIYPAGMLAISIVFTLYAGAGVTSLMYLRLVNKTSNPNRLSFSTLNMFMSFVLQRLNALSVTGLRSAVWATKIQSFIVPEIQRRAGHKPTILLTLGAAHLDLAQYLIHPKQASILTRLFSWSDYEPRDKEYLHTVLEINFDGQYPAWGKKIGEGNEYSRILYELDSNTPALKHDGGVRMADAPGQSDLFDQPPGILEWKELGGKKFWVLSGEHGWTGNLAVVEKFNATAVGKINADPSAWNAIIIEGGLRKTLSQETFMAKALSESTGLPIVDPIFSIDDAIVMEGAAALYPNVDLVLQRIRAISIIENTQLLNQDESPSDDILNEVLRSKAVLWGVEYSDLAAWVKAYNQYSTSSIDAESLEVEMADYKNKLLQVSNWISYQVLQYQIRDYDHGKPFFMMIGSDHLDLFNIGWIPQAYQLSDADIENIVRTQNERLDQLGLLDAARMADKVHPKLKELSIREFVEYEGYFLTEFGVTQGRQWARNLMLSTGMLRLQLIEQFAELWGQSANEFVIKSLIQDVFADLLDENSTELINAVADKYFKNTIDQRVRATGEVMVTIDHGLHTVPSMNIVSVTNAIAEKLKLKIFLKSKTTGLIVLADSVFAIMGSSFGQNESLEILVVEDTKEQRPALLQSVVQIMQDLITDERALTDAWGSTRIQPYINRINDLARHYPPLTTPRMAHSTADRHATDQGESRRPKFLVIPEDILVMNKIRGQSTLKEDANSIWKDVPKEFKDAQIIMDLPISHSGVIVLSRSSVINDRYEVIGLQKGLATYQIPLQKDEAIDIKLIGNRQRITMRGTDTEESTTRMFHPKNSSIEQFGDNSYLQIQIQVGEEDELENLLIKHGISTEHIVRTTALNFNLETLTSETYRRSFWSELNGLLKSLNLEEIFEQDLSEKSLDSMAQEDTDHDILRQMLNSEFFIQDIFSDLFARSDIQLKDVNVRNVEHIGQGGFRRVYRVEAKVRGEQKLYVFAVKIVQADVLRSDSKRAYDEAYVLELNHLNELVRSHDLRLMPATSGPHLIEDFEGRIRIVTSDANVDTTGAIMTEEDFNRAIVAAYFRFYQIMKSQGLNSFVEDPKKANAFVRRKARKSFDAIIIDYDNVYFSDQWPVDVLGHLLDYGNSPKDIIASAIQVLGRKVAVNFFRDAVVHFNYRFVSRNKEFLEEIKLLISQDDPVKAGQIKFLGDAFTEYTQLIDNGKVEDSPPLPIPHAVTVTINGLNRRAPNHSSLLDLLSDIYLDLQMTEIRIDGKLIIANSPSAKLRALESTRVSGGENIVFYRRGTAEEAVAPIVVASPQEGGYWPDVNRYLNKGGFKDNLQQLRRLVSKISRPHPRHLRDTGWVSKLGMHIRDIIQRIDRYSSGYYDDSPVEMSNFERLLKDAERLDFMTTEHRDGYLAQVQSIVSLAEEILEKYELASIMTTSELEKNLGQSRMAKVKFEDEVQAGQVLGIGFDGDLAGVAEIVVRLGVNGWKTPSEDIRSAWEAVRGNDGTLEIAVSNVTQGIQLSIPDQGVESIDFAVRVDGVWDNNSGKDYHVRVDRTEVILKGVDTIAESMMLYPKALLHSRDLYMYLDDYDREHFEFIEGSDGGKGYWRHKYFNTIEASRGMAYGGYELVLGTWEDIEPKYTWSNSRIKRDVVTRYKDPAGKAVSFYFFDNHVRSIFYYAEAVERGEIFANGNTQLFVDAHSDVWDRGLILDPDYTLDTSQIDKSIFFDAKRLSASHWGGGIYIDVGQTFAMSNFNSALFALGLISHHYFIIENDTSLSAEEVNPADLLVGTADDFIASPPPLSLDGSMLFNFDSDASGFYDRQPHSGGFRRPNPQEEDYSYFSTFLRGLTTQGIYPDTFHGSTTFSSGATQIIDYGHFEILRFLARVAPALTLHLELRSSKEVEVLSPGNIDQVIEWHIQNVASPARLAGAEKISVGDPHVASAPQDDGVDNPQDDGVENRGGVIGQWVGTEREALGVFLYGLWQAQGARFDGQHIWVVGDEALAPVLAENAEGRVILSLVGLEDLMREVNITVEEARDITRKYHRDQSALEEKYVAGTSTTYMLLKSEAQRDYQHHMNRYDSRGVKQSIPKGVVIKSSIIDLNMSPQALELHLRLLIQSLVGVHEISRETSFYLDTGFVEHKALIDQMLAEYQASNFIHIDSPIESIVATIDSLSEKVSQGLTIDISQITEGNIPFYFTNAIYQALKGLNAFTNTNTQTLDFSQYDADEVEELVHNHNKFSKNQINDKSIYIQLIQSIDFKLRQLNRWDILKPIPLGYILKSLKRTIQMSGTSA